MSLETADTAQAVADDAAVPQPSTADVKEPPKADDKGDAAAPKDDQVTDDTATDPEPRKPRGVQKRIDELTREKNDWKRIAEMATAGKAPEAPAPQSQPAIGTEAPPKLEDYADYDDYNRAVARHEARQELRAEREREEGERAKAERQKATKAFLARAEKLADRVPGLSESMEMARAGEIPISIDAAMVVIEEMERGPEVVHFLAQNPDEALRIGNMKPAAQIRALTLIEERLPSVEPKRVTNAPAPVSRVSGAGDAARKTPAEMSMAEYAVWQAARDKRA